MTPRVLTRLACAAAIVAVSGGATAKPKPGATPPVAAPAPEWRTPDPQNLLVIDTNKGRIIVEMYPAIAPESVERVRTLAKRHFYDGLLFFRVVDGFMDQTGDPKNTGEGGSELPNVKAEFGFRRGPEMPFTPAIETAGLSSGFVGVMPVAGQGDALMAMTADGKVNAWGLFCSGTLGMARAEDPGSANSQFFLMRDAYASLNRKYTPWGRVIIGQDVVNAVKVGEPVEAPQDKMITVRLVSDLPEAQRPKVQVVDTLSAGFRAELAKAVAAKGEGEFSVCDVPVPAKLLP